MKLFKRALNKDDKSGKEKIDMSKRAVTATAFSVAAAGVFYGLSYSPISPISTAVADEGHDHDFACWGINSCKGKTACTTAFNGCAGKNSCKGKGFLKMTEEECSEKGGKPLKGSEGDPDKKS